MSERTTVCALVRDLLPLWRDGLVSPQTAALVKDHLAKCPPCRALAQAADDFEYHLAAAAPPPLEGAADRFLARLRVRLRRRTQAVAAVAGIMVLAAGAAGSGVASARLVTAEQRYQEFLATVPGYLAAKETGALVPLHRKLRLGHETITLRAFFVNYFGSFAVFTAKGEDGKAPIPPQGAKASPPTLVWTSPIGNNSIVGYLQVNSVTVPTPVDPESPQPTRVLLALTLPAPEAASVSTSIAVPKSAYLVHGATVHRSPITLQAGGVTVHLESIELSSAGTLILGESHGGYFTFQDPTTCPAFLGQACLTWPNWRMTWGLPRSDGWQSFAWMLPGPTNKPSAAAKIALPLPGLDVRTTLHVTSRIKWPIQLSQGKTSFGTPELVPVVLGTAGGYTVQLSSDAGANGFTVGIYTRSGEPLPQGVSVTLPRGEALRATWDGTMTGTVSGQGFQERFPFRWVAPPSPAQLAQQGTATMTVTFDTYALHPLPDGTVWRP